MTGPSNLVPAAWTPDGRHLFYYAIPDDAVSPAQAAPTVWVQDVVANGAPTALSGIGGVDVSPDGRWVAYHSTESGRHEVYVDAFPGPGPRFQVSTAGGGSPIWRADGRELFYVLATSEARPARPGEAEVRMMSVGVTPGPGAALTFGTPRQLFMGRYSINAPARGYDVTGDGQRFLLLQARELVPDVITHLLVVQNWSSELR